MTKNKDGSVLYEPYERLSYTQRVMEIITLVIMLPKILYFIFKKS